jgi:hypothetical protein
MVGNRGIEKTKTSRHICLFAGIEKSQNGVRKTGIISG